MNKDMINIDDFVKEKLQSHSEEQYTAPWPKMKALLDKEKPEKVVPIGFRYGKQLSILAAVLLVGALCVGSYQLSSVRHAEQVANHTEQKDHALTVNSAMESSATHPTPAEKNPANLAKNASAAVQTKSSLTKQDPIAVVAPVNTTQSAQMTPKKTQHKGAKSVAQAEANSSLNEHLDAQGNLQSNNTIAHNKQADAEAKGVITNNHTGKSIASGASAKSYTKALPKAMRQQQTNVSARSTQAIKATTPVVVNKADMKTFTVKTAATTHNTKTMPVSNNGSQQKGNESNSIRADEAHSDTMLATTIVTKELATKGFPRKVVRVVDTIAKDKIVLGNTAAVSQDVNTKKVDEATKTQQLKASVGKNASTPMAAATAQTINNANQKNSQPKQIASTQKHVLASLFKQLNLPEAVANAKHDLRNAQFYWGFNGGLNYTYSSSINFKGIQFGPTGELVFNKHWSLFGAINYFNRSGSKKTVNDNFSSQKTSLDADSIKGANYYFTVSADSTNRYFNFSTVHSFEMPLAVRYAFKKLYVMGGVNLAYYLRVNVEKVEKQYNNVNPHVVVVNTTKPILMQTNPMLSSADFGSRFGVGYIIGVGYQINSSWQADLRMSTLFWDNAKGAGAQTLSNAFYRLPSVHISLGYQFNRSGLRASFGPTP